LHNIRAMERGTQLRKPSGHLKTEVNPDIPPEESTTRHGDPTLDEHLTLLAELREQARTAGKFDAAISAEHKRGQALGFYVNRSESGKPGDFTAGMTVEEIDRELAKLMTEWAITQAKRTDPEPRP
jgi:hypothetical protein